MLESEVRAGGGSEDRLDSEARPGPKHDELGRINVESRCKRDMYCYLIT